MKALIFIQKIFKKYPVLFISNVILLVIMSLFAVGSLFTISPIIDFIMHPDLQGVSTLTLKIINIMKFLHLPITIEILLMIFVIFVTLSSIFHVFARKALLKTKYVVLRDMTFGMFEDFFNARWHFFSSSKQGILLNTFNRELIIVGGTFGEMTLLFAIVLQTIFFLAVPFCISWKVTSISLGIAALFAIPFILLGKISYKLGLLSTSTANDMYSIIHEDMSLAKVILGFGKQRKSLANLAVAFDNHVKATIKSQVLDMCIPILYRPFSAVMIAIALFVAQWFKVALSEMSVLMLALLQVAVSIGTLAKQKNALENFFPSYEQIESLRQRARELKQVSGARQFDGIFQEINMERVSFAYPGHKPALVDINIRIPRGKMIAIVGESGAGKSTFIDLIMGFYQPVAGRIIFDDIPFEEFDIFSYRSKIGYVPQDSILFNMTIQDNLLWGHVSVSREEIFEACRRANADEFIEQLPNGYNTIVGDRGVRLSGGQRQRIALARAILRKPNLLILDEATSSLDTYSEKLIQRAIESIAKETTVIVIAHRISTIANADYIYVLNRGHLIEEGTYQQLTEKEGHFSRMVKLQVIEAVDRKIA